MSLQNGRFAKSEIHVAKGDYMCKLDLKDTYFLASLKKIQGNLFASVGLEICTSSFAFAGLGPAARIFTKLLKVSMTILRKINIKIIIYLNDMLFIGHSLEETAMSRDTVIFLLQHLGFVINWKKSVLIPVQEIELLDLTINSVTLELSLNKTKIQKVVSRCQNLLNNPQTSILELTRLIDLLTSTIQAVLPARLNCRLLQIQQISSNTTNIIFIGKPFSFRQNCFERKLKNRTEMVGTKLRTAQWSGINPTACRGVNTDRCLSKGLGATCNGTSTGRMWSAQEMKNHINVRELLAIKLAIQTFSKTLKHKTINFQVDNMVALTYLLKMGGTTSPINKRNMRSSSPMWDHSYCRVPSQQTERDSILEVKKRFGLLGMETSSPVISENLSTEGNSRDRSICFQIISSDQDLLFVEVRSIEPSSRCLPKKLAPQESLCFFPILHNRKSFEQSPERESTYDDPSNSSLAITTVVPRSNENVHTTINFIDLEERSLKKPAGRNSSPFPKPNFKISGMDGLRARLQKKGVSREASNLIIKSRRSSSNSNHESAWGKWAGWCAERKIDPFCSNINQILEFLSQLFQNGLQYRTINNYRSARSAFHDHIQGKPVGEHPRICSLVAGVFNSRPPQPRYCFIWNF